MDYSPSWKNVQRKVTVRKESDKSNPNKLRKVFITKRIIPSAQPSFQDDMSNQPVFCPDHNYVIRSNLSLIFSQKMNSNMIRDVLTRNFSTQYAYFFPHMNPLFQHSAQHFYSVLQIPIIHRDWKSSLACAYDSILNSSLPSYFYLVVSPGVFVLFIGSPCKAFVSSSSERFRERLSNSSIFYSSAIKEDNTENDSEDSIGDVNEGSLKSAYMWLNQLGVGPDDFPLRMDHKTYIETSFPLVVHGKENVDKFVEFWLAQVYFRERGSGDPHSLADSDPPTILAPFPFNNATIRKLDWNVVETPESILLNIPDVVLPNQMEALATILGANGLVNFCRFSQTEVDKCIVKNTHFFADISSFLTD